MIIILFAIALTLSLLMTIQEVFVDSVDQDQTAQYMQSYLQSTLSTFFNLLFLYLAMALYIQPNKKHNLFIW